MPDTAGARRRVRILACGLLQLSQKCLVVLGREAGVHRNDVGRGRDVDDGREVRQRVVGRLGVDGRVGGRGGDRGNAQRVAVRGRLGRFIGAHDATATRLVFHDDALAQGLAQRVGDHAGNDVGGAAGCKGHLQLDDFVRVGLCGCRSCSSGQYQRDPVATVHRFLLLGFSYVCNVMRMFFRQVLGISHRYTGHTRRCVVPDAAAG